MNNMGQAATAVLCELLAVLRKVSIILDRIIEDDDDDRAEADARESQERPAAGRRRPRATGRPG